jgi:hypothetical protein
MGFKFLPEVWCTVEAPNALQPLEFERGRRHEARVQPSVPTLRLLQGKTCFSSTKVA